MIVAALPIDEGEFCWEFVVLNDDTEPYDELVVESASYVWGDNATTELVGTRSLAIAPGERRRVHREIATELRTGLTMRVVSQSGTVRVYAEVGRLYATPTGMQPIAALGCDGKLAELS